jgi:sec-independent protein translocase protein TatB
MGMPPTIEVASLGWEDSLILMVMALVVFGPRRLPEIARQLGKLMYEVRKASSDFKFQMEEELRQAEEADRRQKQAEQQANQPPTLEAPALAANPTEAIQPANPTEAIAELPGHAEINAMFEAVEDWPATPVSSPLPLEAPALPSSPPAEETSPHQEQVRNG